MKNSKSAQYETKSFSQNNKQNYNQTNSLTNRYRIRKRQHACMSNPNDIRFSLKAPAGGRHYCADRTFKITIYLLARRKRSSATPSIVRIPITHTLKWILLLLVTMNKAEREPLRRRDTYVRPHLYCRPASNIWVLRINAAIRGERSENANSPRFYGHATWGGRRKNFYSEDVHV